MTITDMYSHDVLCKNCSKIIWFDIKRGTAVEEYLEGNKLCPKCGCEHS